MNKRPSDACAIDVARVRPVTKISFFVKPLGTALLPPNCTVTVVHGEMLPAASRARARTMCWPAA